MLSARRVVGNDNFVHTVDGVAYPERVERRTRADCPVNSVGRGVGYREVNNEIHKTARGRVAEVLRVNACGCVGRIINATNWHIAHVGVGVDIIAGTKGAVDGVAQGIPHKKVDGKQAVAAANSKQRLIVRAGACHGVAILDKGITCTYLRCDGAI